MAGDRNLSIRLLARGFAVLCASLIGTMFAGSALAAPTLTALYAFTGSTDGAFPAAGLIADTTGNLYGTTTYGGIYNTQCFGTNSRCGVVFKLSPPIAPATRWTETVLYSFCSAGPCRDGAIPVAGLIADSAGNFYGTTFAGGSCSGSACNSCSNIGCGVVFKLAPPVPPATQWTETVLYNFTGALLLTTGTKDGAIPDAGLVADSSGNLYGTTEIAGGGGRDGDTLGNGGVFKLRQDGKEGFWYPFHITDGFHPVAGLIFDSSGNLYGTTTQGGGLGLGYCGSAAHGCGVVFKLSPGRIETVLHFFTGGSDGGLPYAALIADRAGNLYGTTQYGGRTGCLYGSTQCGVVFKLSPPVPPATQWTETVLHAFTGDDGGSPLAGLIADSAGNLYGTTLSGGRTGCLYGSKQCGVVFKLAPPVPPATRWTETVLHSFTGGRDGALSVAGLLADSQGNFYGTTKNGGAYGQGVVFKLSP